MEDGYTQLGTVLIDQRPEDSEGDGVIAVGRFKGIPARGGSRKGYRHPLGIRGQPLAH